MGFFRNLLGLGSKKEISISTTSIGTAVWSNRDYNNFCKETYLKNVISFRCIDEISRSVASVPWKLFTQGKDGFKTEIVNHPINDLLKRPNPTEGFCFLIERLMAYLVMSGNTYLRRIKPLSGPNKLYPKELWVLRPDRITIVRDDKNNVSGYEYKVSDNASKTETMIFKVDPLTLQADILQMKLFNPIDDFYGAAITESVAREIDTFNSATEWNKRLIDNECKPGFIVTYTKNITEQMFKRLETQLNERHSGPKNVGKNLIIEGADGTKVEKFGLSPAEMDFTEGGRELARKIALGFGVPSMLLGIPGDQTYSNYTEARLAFWEGPVFYYLNLLRTELNNWLINKNEKITLEYDLGGVPALAVKQNLLWERAKTSDFITINEKREMVGFEKIEGGEQLLVPISVMPLGESAEEDFSQIEEDAKKRLADQGKTEDEINEEMNNEEL